MSSFRLQRKGMVEAAAAAVPAAVILHLPKNRKNPAVAVAVVKCKKGRSSRGMTDLLTLFTVLLTKDGGGDTVMLFEGAGEGRKTVESALITDIRYGSVGGLEQTGGKAHPQIREIVGETLAG